MLHTLNAIRDARLGKDAEFESKHPRGEGGKFSEGGGSDGAVKRLLAGIPKRHLAGLTRVSVGDTITGGEMEYHPASKEIRIRRDILNTHLFRSEADAHKFMGTTDYKAWFKQNKGHSIHISGSAGNQYDIADKGDVQPSRLRHMLAHEVGHHVQNTLSPEAVRLGEKLFRKLSTYTTGAYAEYIQDRQDSFTSNPLVDRKLAREQFAEAFRQYVREGKHKKEFARIFAADQRPNRTVATKKTS